MRPMALIGAAGACLVVVLVAVLGGGAIMMEQQNRRDATVAVGDKLKPGVIPPEYEPLINQAASTCPEVTAPLLAAQIQQESNWNANATSSAGAAGPAQFMPGTWASVGRDYSGDGRADVRDPADAIPAQARYMCDLVGQVRGIPGDLIDLALAAYNAGLGRVQSAQGVPQITETTQYVHIVRASAAQFAQPPAAGAVIAGGWTVPTAGRCTSGFGARWGEPHNGLDLAAPVGTPIVAGATGTVTAAGPASGYGQWVVLSHAGGVSSTYGHIESFSVAPGQQVQAGQPIATVGNRGQSTGPHLHFQIEQNGTPVEPLAFYHSQGAPSLCGGSPPQA